MISTIQQFPLIAISDCFISFLQYMFSSPDRSPSDYRWNVDELQTKIFISGPYTVTRQKVGQVPTITISRTEFVFQNRVIDNLNKQDNILSEKIDRLDLMEGQVVIVFEAGTGPEATGLASLASLMIQDSRKKIASNSGFMNTIRWVGISPEQPVAEAGTIRRWQVSCSFNVTLRVGWMNIVTDPQPFNKFNIYDAESIGWNSVYGSVTLGSDLIVDGTANFGFYTSCKPSFLAEEFRRGWYFINIGESNKKYKVEELVDNHTLRLSVVDSDGNTVPFNPEATGVVSYGLMWNATHVDIEWPLKKK